MKMFLNPYSCLISYFLDGIFLFFHRTIISGQTLIKDTYGYQTPEGIVYGPDISLEFTKEGSRQTSSIDHDH